ncbi:hypothetical protein ACSDX7_000752 [Campylobacter jejuni]
MFKSLNIGLKLIFSVAAVVVIGLVILISLITKQVSQNITKIQKIFLLLSRKNMLPKLKEFLGK